MVQIRYDPNILFSYAFRPFFLLVGAYAILAVLAWSLQLGGWMSWPGALPASVRHGHEMIFGFAGAAIAGFLLTAVATWTGRPPVAGPLLMLVCATWVTARVGAFLPGAWGPAIWSVASLVFWAELLLLMLREVTAVRDSRNYKVPVLLALFLLAEAHFFVSASGEVEGLRMALRGGLCLVVGMVLLIGGRIIPSFTQNWLRLNRPMLTDRLPFFDGYDGTTVALSALFALGFIFWPDSQWPGVLGIAASGLQFVRLARWRGWLVWTEPLLCVLHVGYAWLPIGLLMLGSGMLLRSPGLWDSGLHALGYGVIGTLILGVAARVALGHTGRLLRASPSMVFAFGAMTLGTILRILAQPGGPLMWASVVLWVAAYLLFVIRYLPILLAPRIGP